MQIISIFLKVFSFLKTYRKWIMPILLAIAIVIIILLCMSGRGIKAELTRVTTNYTISKTKNDSLIGVNETVTRITQSYEFTVKELKKDTSKLLRDMRKLASNSYVKAKNINTYANAQSHFDVTLRQKADSMYLAGDDLKPDSNLLNDTGKAVFKYDDKYISILRWCEKPDDCLTMIKAPFNETVIEYRYKKSKIFFIRWFQKWQYNWLAETDNPYVKVDKITVINKKK